MFLRIKGLIANLNKVHLIPCIIDNRYYAILHNYIDQTLRLLHVHLKNYSGKNSLFSTVISIPLSRDARTMSPRHRAYIANHLKVSMAILFVFTYLKINISTVDRPSCSRRKHFSKIDFQTGI
jgi:hypothetical protein